MTDECLVDERAQLKLNPLLDRQPVQDSQSGRHMVAWSEVHDDSSGGVRSGKYGITIVQARQHERRDESRHDITPELSTQRPQPAQMNETTVEINSGVYFLKSKIRQVPLLFTSGGLGLVILVLVLKIWSCLDHWIRSLLDLERSPEKYAN